MQGRFFASKAGKQPLNTTKKHDLANQTKPSEAVIKFSKPAHSKMLISDIAMTSSDQLQSNVIDHNTMDLTLLCNLLKLMIRVLKMIISYISIGIKKESRLVIQMCRIRTKNTTILTFLFILKMPKNLFCPATFCIYKPTISYKNSNKLNLLLEIPTIASKIY